MSTYAFQMLCKVGLSDQLSRSVVPKLKIRSYEANDIIWSKGHEIESWHLIMSGLVAATAPVNHGVSAPVTIYGHHAWFGEQSILSQNPSYLDYVCLTPTQTISMSVAALREIFETEPAFTRFIAKLMEWREQKKTEMLILMKLGNPCQRVVIGLALLVEALAYRSEPPPDVAMIGSIEIPINQTVLASLFGVSRTLVSEYLQELARAGFLRITYGRLELVSLGTWHRFINSWRQQRVNNTNPTIQQLLLELYLASDLSPITPSVKNREVQGMHS